MSVALAAQGERARDTPAGRVAIVTESTSCLPPELAKEYGIRVLPVPFVIGSDTYLDSGGDVPPALAARLADARLGFKTSPPSPGAYLEMWQAAAQAADAVVLVTVAEALSTMQRSIRLARTLADTQLPDTRVMVLDSGSAGMGQGFVALAAARSATNGVPLDEVMAVATQVRERVQLVVVLDTLRYVGRTTRIAQIASLVGALVPIKPVAQLSGGRVRLVGRPRTRRRAVEQLTETLRTQIGQATRLHVAVHYTGAPDEASRLEETLRTTYDCVESLVVPFTPAMSGYVGPGLLGVAYYADMVAHAE